MSTLPSPTHSSLPSTAASSRTASPSGRPSTTLPTRRPNRAALRDYYGLKNAAAPDPPNGASQHEEVDSGVRSSELDSDGFDAEAYVRRVLAGQGLEGVLRVEGGLINEIKGLDGERKALVYDNYSKLITATDTIRKMRTNMDPLTPTTSMLEPAVAHIADTTTSLAKRLRDREVAKGEMGGEAEEEAGTNAMTARRKQQETVRWVLGSPRRLGVLLDAGSKEEAEKDWEEVKGLLGRWQGIAGVEEVRDECERIMGRT